MEETNYQNTNETETKQNEKISLKGRWINIKKILPNFLNYKFLNICLGVGCVAFVVSYLFFSNILISRGFAINELRTDLQNLNKANTGLELEVMQLESFTSISDKLAEANMVGVGDIEYIEVIEEAVALR